MLTHPQRWLYILWLLGFALLPFSNGLSEGGVIINYGMPILALCTVGILFYVQRLDDSPGVIFLIVGGLVIAGLVIFSLIAADNLFVSGWRAAFWVNGILLFFTLGGVLGLRWFTPRMIAQGIMLGGAVLAAYYLVNFTLACLQNGVGVVLLERYVGGLASLPWGASNIVAGCLLITLVTCGLSYRVEPQRRTLWITLLILAGIISTFSRTVIGLSVVYLLVLMLFSNLRLALAVVMGLGVIGGIAYIVINSVGSYYLDTFIQSRTNVQEISNLNTRSDIWTEFITAASENNYLPIGFYGSLSRFTHSGHNIFITALVEQGLLGPLVLALFYVGMILHRVDVLFLKLRTAGWKTGFLAVSALLVVYSESFFEDSYFSQPFAYLFWAFMALLIRLGREPWGAPEVVAVAERRPRRRLFYWGTPLR